MCVFIQWSFEDSINRSIDWLVVFRYRNYPVVGWWQLIINYLWRNSSDFKFSERTRACFSHIHISGLAGKKGNNNSGGWRRRRWKKKNKSCEKSKKKGSAKECKKSRNCGLGLLRQQRIDTTICISMTKVFFLQEEEGKERKVTSEECVVVVEDMFGFVVAAVVVVVAASSGIKSCKSPWVITSECIYIWFRSTSINFKRLSKTVLKLTRLRSAVRLKRRKMNELIMSFSFSFSRFEYEGGRVTVEVLGFCKLAEKWDFVFF